MQNLWQVINILGPNTLMVEYEGRDDRKSITFYGFYYSFRPHKYDPNYIELVMVWPL
jgi:hypothetical protein